MFAQNPAYVAYESLLKRLHRLITEGKEDSEEAEAIREAMGMPFLHLKKEEKERLNHLSSDLYQLQGDEVYEPVTDPAVRTETFMRDAVNEAHAHKDWEKLLSLLRKGPDYLAPHQLAFLRANAYGNLGHTDTALLFMQYASEKEPQNAFYTTEVLRLLCDLEHTEEAIAQAYYCLSDANSQPNGLILSALVLYGSTENQLMEDANPIYHQIIKTLKRATYQVQASSILPPELISDAYLLLGYVYDALSQHTDAYAAYANALEWNRDNSAASEALRLLDQQKVDTSEKASGLLGWREPPTQHIGPLPKLHDHAEGKSAQMALAA